MNDEIPFCRKCLKCGGFFATNQPGNFCWDCRKLLVVPFDPTKPVKTTDGHHAEILCRDFNGQLLARVSVQCKWTACIYTQDGISISGYASLVNVPVVHTREVWVNHYAEGIKPDVHISKSDADRLAGEYRIGCTFTCFNFEEGHDL